VLMIVIVRVVMVMMLMLLGIRYFCLQLRSLIYLCHLSRGQFHAFQIASVYAASSPVRPASAIHASYLLYELG
jgi:hypothetical protein